MEQRSILIVGSSSQMDGPLRNTLVERGFRVAGASDVQEGIELIRSTRFDLLLLDVPDKAAIRVCQEIRSISDMGIILLATSSAEKDMVEALLSGADDYLTKPFSNSKLLARIRAVLRRISVVSRSECSRISLDGVEVDFDRRRITVGCKEERLTPKEFDVLRYLASRANQTVGHRELLQAVWGLDYGTTEHCLRHYVGKLRKKIEASPNQPKYLLTVPWVGYHLRLPE